MGMPCSSSPPPCGGQWVTLTVLVQGKEVQQRVYTKTEIKPTNLASFSVLVLFLSSCQK